MAYSDFTVKRVEQELGIEVVTIANLFQDTIAVSPSNWLRETLGQSERLARLIGTEKAKSEFLIAPILMELTVQLQPQVSLFSGTELNVSSEKGLQGFCDFIVSQSTRQLELTAPIITIVEAKNDNLKTGLGQCMAEMVAAQLFNVQAGEPIDRIYGVVTTGTNWLFMDLMGQEIRVDDREYFINELDRILGILMMPFN